MKIWIRRNGKRVKVDRRGNRVRTDRVGSGHSPWGSPRWYGTATLSEYHRAIDRAHPKG